MRGYLPTIRIPTTTRPHATTHAHTHTRTHAHTHTRTHTYTHAHTRVRACTHTDAGDVYAWGVNKGNVLGNVLGQGAYNVMVRATRMNVSEPAAQASIGCVTHEQELQYRWL